MDTQPLLDLGLTTKEVEIYLALLKQGQSSAGELAKSTPISRPHLYDGLRSLISRGLVSSVHKGKKQYFTAAPPDQLQNLIDEMENRISNIIPELQKITQSIEGPRVEVYEGPLGLKTILMDMAKEETEVVSIYHKSILHEIYDSKWLTYYNTLRKKRKIKARSIISCKTTKRNPVVQYRFLEGSDSHTRLHVYRNKSVTVLIPTDKAGKLMKEKIVAVVIEDEQTATSYRMKFESLWKQAKPIS